MNGCSSLRAASNTANKLRHATVALVASVATQIGLDPFDVPIAKIAPEKLIHALRAFMESKIGQRIVYLIHRRRQPRKNPAHPASGTCPFNEYGASARTSGDANVSSVVPPCSNFSRFTNKNRAAFQILLAKFRAPASRSSDKTMSVPGAAMRRQSKTASHRCRTADSAPPDRVQCLWTWTSFRRCQCAPANAGTPRGRELRPVKCIPSMIIRATQKNKMS